MFWMKPNMRWLYRETTGELTCVQSRGLDDYCDYCSRRKVCKYTAVVHGKKWGQACFPHAGRLLLDALEHDEAARLKVLRIT